MGLICWWGGVGGVGGLDVLVGWDGCVGGVDVFVCWMWMNLSVRYHKIYLIVSNPFLRRRFFLLRADNCVDETGRSPACREGESDTGRQAGMQASRH